MAASPPAPTTNQRGGSNPQETSRASEQKKYPAPEYNVSFERATGPHHFHGTLKVAGVPMKSDASPIPTSPHECKHVERVNSSQTFLIIRPAGCRIPVSPSSHPY